MPTLYDFLEKEERSPQFHQLTSSIRYFWQHYKLYLEISEPSDTFKEEIANFLKFMSELANPTAYELMFDMELGEDLFAEVLSLSEVDLTTREGVVFAYNGFARLNLLEPMLDHSEQHKTPLTQVMHFVFLFLQDIKHNPRKIGDIYLNCRQRADDLFEEIVGKLIKRMPARVDLSEASREDLKFLVFVLRPICMHFMQEQLQKTCATLYPSALFSSSAIREKELAGLRDHSIKPF